MSHAAELTTEARDIVITRRFDAPRALVFMAWTDPVMMSAWWGPKAFTATAEMDVREGGDFRLTMHGPEGAEVRLRGTFGEIVPNALLVLIMDTSEHAADWHAIVRQAFVDAGGAEGDYASYPIETRVTFEDDGAGTLMTVRQSFTLTAMRDAHVALGSGIGWGESFDKMDAVLAKELR